MESLGLNALLTKVETVANLKKSLSFKINHKKPASLRILSERFFVS